MRCLKSCCLINHSSLKHIFDSMDDENQKFLEFKMKIRDIIINLIENFSVNNFMTGMDVGVEQCSAEMIIELKNKFPNITLNGVLPYENITVNWTEVQRDKYYSIMQKIDKETLLQYKYSYDCLRARDLYMINKSKFIMLFIDNDNKKDRVIKYAKSIGKIVFILNLESLNAVSQIKVCK